MAGPQEIDLDGRRGAWRTWILPAVLAILLLALAATSVVLVLDRREPLPEEESVAPASIGSGAIGDDPAQQAVARARLAARSYFTLGHTTVEADMGRLRELSTPAFVEEYDETAPALARRVVAQELELSASLPENGVATEYLSRNNAQLLVSVDVTTRREETTSTAEYRTRVLLQRVGGEWLLSAFDEVP